jgi:hypothetical protein
MPHLTLAGCTHNAKRVLFIAGEFQIKIAQNTLKTNLTGQVMTVAGNFANLLSGKDSMPYITPLPW